MASGDVLVLEALPAMYYEQAHLPGALNLPLDEIDALAPTLIPSPSTPVVTYCTGTTCPNSGIAAARLRALGYEDVRAFEGGKEAWEAQSLPFERGRVEA